MRISTGKGIDRDLLPELWVKLDDPEGKKGAIVIKKMGARILNQIPAVNETSRTGEWNRIPQREKATKLPLTDNYDHSRGMSQPCLQVEVETFG